MRLIDADVLETHTYWECFENPDDDYEYVLKTDIDNAPTIEAEPVKHGRWEGDGQCSVCKDYPLARYMRNPNYCPNCGAKMEEDANE